MKIRFSEERKLLLGSGREVGLTLFYVGEGDDVDHAGVSAPPPAVATSIVSLVGSSVKNHSWKLS